MHKHLWQKAFFAAVLLLLSFASSAQCAMCRAALENEDGGKKAAGVNDGIVYLMIFPYLLVLVLGIVIYRAIKKAKIEEK